MRLDWEKANRQEALSRARTPRAPNKKILDQRHKALQAFAERHNLDCFKCGRGGPWAKSGISTRGPWIICASCVTSDKQPKPRLPIAEA